MYTEMLIELNTFIEVDECIPWPGEEGKVTKETDGSKVEASRAPIFSKEKDLLEPAFVFGVDIINSRTWSFDLVYCGQDLDSMHINIVLYYMRKKYTEDPTCLQLDDVVGYYIKGMRLACGKAWKDVDYVLMHVNTIDHWILVCLDFKRRGLFDGLSEQEMRDCGAYTLAFADYFSFSKKAFPDTFTVEGYRQRLGCLLFHYGRMKQDDGYTSQPETEEHNIGVQFAKKD